MLNVIAIVFFTTLLDALLPDGSMRSYLKMAMGFFVVLTFLQPVMQLLQPDGMLQQWQLAFNAGTMECLPVQGEQYEQQQNKVDAACQQKIEEQIKALLLLSNQMESIDVSCMVKGCVLQQITLTIPQGAAIDYERIRLALSGYYGLEPEQICIKNGEAGICALE
jgi:stage III sporulation protein AF